MSTDARAVAEPLLGFADSLPAAAADTAAPAAMLHLLTFTLEREEFGIPVTRPTSGASPTSAAGSSRWWRSAPGSA